MGKRSEKSCICGISGLTTAAIFLPQPDAHLMMICQELMPVRCTLITLFTLGLQSCALVHQGSVKQPLHIFSVLHLFSFHRGHGRV